MFKSLVIQILSFLMAGVALTCMSHYHCWEHSALIVDEIIYTIKTFMKEYTFFLDVIY